MSFEESHSNQDKDRTEFIKIWLRKYDKYVIAIFNALTGHSPKVLFPSIALIDILLILYNQYDLGFFVLALLVASTFYLILALSALVPQILAFFHQEPNGKEEQTLELVASILANAEVYIKKAFEILFEGKILSPPVNIAAIAAIWIVGIFIVKFICRFWIVFLAINIAAILPNILYIQANAQTAAKVEPAAIPTPKAAPAEYPTVEPTPEPASEPKD